MDNVFNITNTKKCKKGLVEIFHTYDGEHYRIFLDGKELQEFYKENYESTLLSRKFIKTCVKESEVDEDNLIFVYYDLYYFGESSIQDYDSNDYTSYSKILNLIKTLLTDKDKIALFKKKYMTYHVKGIDDLEEELT